MAEQVYETLRRIQAGRWQVRLWISGWADDRADVLEGQARVIAEAESSSKEICRRISMLPAINAVEVLEYSTLNGHLIYPEWP